MFDWISAEHGQRCSPLLFFRLMCTMNFIFQFSLALDHTRIQHNDDAVHELTAFFFRAQLDDCQISCNFSVLLLGHCSLFTLLRHCFAIKLKIFHLILFFCISFVLFFLFIVFYYTLCFMCPCWMTHKDLPKCAEFDNFRMMRHTNEKKNESLPIFDWWKLKLKYRAFVIGAYFFHFIPLWLSLSLSIAAIKSNKQIVRC